MNKALTREELLGSMVLVPSFYGFVAWTLAYAFFTLRLLEWYESPPGVHFIYLFVSASFFISMALFLKPYALSRFRPEFQVMRLGIITESYLFLVSRRTLMVLHLMGFIGLFLHFSQVVDSLAGLGGLLVALFQDSYLIRQTDVEPVGIYISYFGWLAIPLTVLSWRIHPQGMRLLLAAAALQFLLNLFFIDRTRPIWLLFVSFVIWFPFAKQLVIRSLLFRALLIAVTGIVLFFAIGFWVGKRGEWFEAYGHVKVANEIALFYYYLTGGFAYFDTLFETTHQFTFIPERTLYPLFKVGQLLGINPAPPAQILPFVDAPFPTNVGTMLEPLYSDGGLAYCVLGTLGASFVVDLVGLVAIRARNPFCLALWANLCMVSMLAFFVPKQNATQVWLFTTIAIVGFLLTRFGRPRLAKLRMQQETAGNRV